MEVMENIRLVLRNNLRKYRKEAGIKTQEELAEKSRLSVGMIKLVETGERWPSPATMEALAKALGITISELLGQEEMVKKVPMSLVAKRISSIPDPVYEWAEKIGSDSDAWKLIIKLLEREAKKKIKKTLANQA